MSNPDSLRVGFISKEALMGHGGDDPTSSFEGEERLPFPVHKALNGRIVALASITVGGFLKDEEPDEEAKEAAIGCLLGLLGYPLQEELWQECARCFIEGQSDALLAHFFHADKFSRRMAVCSFFEKLRILLAEKFGGEYLEVSETYAHRIIRGAARGREPMKSWYFQLGEALWGENIFAAKLRAAGFSK